MAQKMRSGAVIHVRFERVDAMTVNDQEVQERTESGTMRQQRSYPSYAFLITMYNAIFGAFLLLYRQREEESLERLTGLDVALLAFATLRVAKLVSEDEITSIIREPVIDDLGGEKRPRGNGFRRSLGKLVLCPTCTGTWVAAFLTYSLHLWPRYTRPFLAMMSASGISQLSDALLSLVYTDRDLLRKQQDS
jgi:hypothetical protein